MNLLCTPRAEFPCSYFGGIYLFMFLWGNHLKSRWLCIVIRLDFLLISLVSFLLLYLLSSTLDLYSETQIFLCPVIFTLILHRVLHVFLVYCRPFRSTPPLNSWSISNLRRAVIAKRLNQLDKPYSTRHKNNPIHTKQTVPVFPFWLIALNLLVFTKLLLSL
jgi:hypothetical protein